MIRSMPSTLEISLLVRVGVDGTAIVVGSQKLGHEGHRTAHLTTNAVFVKGAHKRMTTGRVLRTSLS